jgi:outer membrane receptor protein involved in Fe transport
VAASAATSAAAAPAEGSENPQNLEGITVTGYAASVQKAIEIKRDAVGQVDAVFAEDIGKFPDQNLAESLQRIPGVSIVREGGEGRQISVRGLSPDFVRVRIDGMEALATTGSNDNSGGNNRGRSFDFNVFASELFNQIVVHKTDQADIGEVRSARPSTSTHRIRSTSTSSSSPATSKAATTSMRRRTTTRYPTWSARCSPAAAWAS